MILLSFIECVHVILHLRTSERIADLFKAYKYDN